MTIDTNTMVSISEANQNFSKVARLVDERGSAVILKNNVPRYLVIDFSKADEDIIASDEDVLSLTMLQSARQLPEVRNKDIRPLMICHFLTKTLQIFDGEKLQK